MVVNIFLKAIFAVILCSLMGFSLLTKGHAEDEELLSDLLVELRSDEFTKRHEAQTTLLQWVGVAAERRAILKRTYQEQSDPESRLRLKAIFEELFGGLRPGFLGVRFRMGPFETKEGKKIEVMNVSQVIPETGASLGGIKRGDLIAEIAGKGFAVGVQQEDIGVMIRQLPIDEKVIVKLYRERKPLTIRIRITENPNPEPLTERQRKRAFETWFKGLSAEPEED